ARLCLLGGQDAIGVNLSSNAYPISVSPHPQPLPDALGRGGFGFRQNQGGVTRILMVSEIAEYHIFTRV
ncbi:MAG: hypothetical protein RM338_06500, partial [Nostoc sp. DedQUE12a]|nr:hypothetical protein [Nostoc sp. DedQUE12a]